MRGYRMLSCVVPVQSFPVLADLPTPRRHNARSSTANRRIDVGSAGAVLLVAIGMFLTFPATTAAGAADIPIRPLEEREPSRIAVATFDSGRSPVQLKENLFHDVIYGDLELTGYFQRANKQSFIEQAGRIDRKAGKVDFAEWGRIGADFLLAGSYDISGDKIAVTCILYYVNTRKRIFGKRFTNTVDQQRVLAHRISDEIFRYVAAEEGIANTKILYVSTSDPTRRKREVWVMDIDGANARSITNDQSLVATPCWGINATEVYYTSYKDYNPDLCGIYVKGGAPWYVSRFPRLNISPSWSQRRQQIALTLTKDGNSEIYLMTREGKKPTRLTYNRAIDSSPVWSPDGSQIAFTSARSGRPQIYIMDAEGFGARRVSFVGSTYCDSAAWSPKGDKLAFTARTADGRFEIFTCNTDGSSPVQLTSGTGNKEDPCWSPNGLMLAFTSDMTGASHVYIMNSDGGNTRRLTRAGHNTSPAWSPILYGDNK